MKKKIFMGVGIFFALLLIAAILTPFLIDINHFRPVIEKKLEEHLNAKVTLRNLKLSIIRGIGLRIEGIKILNPPGYSDMPLLEVSQAIIYLGTLKSLFGNPTAKITFLKPRIRIEKNESDRLNIKDLIKSKKEESSSSGISKTLALPAGVIGSMMLKGSLVLKIEEGELVYEKNGQKNPKSPDDTISVKNLFFKSGPLSLKNPIHAEIKGTTSPIRHPYGSLEGGFQFKSDISNPIKIIELKRIEFHEKISFDLNLDGNEMVVLSPFFSKEKGGKMNLISKGSYSQNKIEIDQIKLLFPLGQLEAKGSITDFSHSQGELKLLFVTPAGSPDQPEPFQSDMNLSMTFSASLRPFSIEDAQGEIDVRKLSGEIPSFLQPFFSSKKMATKGSGSLRGKSHFQIKNNKPTKIDFENIELDLSPMFLNYNNKWPKPKTEALILKLTGALEQIENRRQLTLSPSSIQFGKMRLNASGKVSLDPGIQKSAFVDLSFSSNVFAAETFKRYLPPLPFNFKGPVEISKLTLLGDPKNTQHLNIQGKISAQKGYLEFNPDYFKEKKWGAEGPIHFSAFSDFAISAKKLTSLKLNMNADFTAAELRLEKSFFKPAQKKLEFNFSSSLEKDLMKFEKLNLEFHNMKLLAQATLSHFSEKQKRYLSLLLSTDSFSLAEWNQFFPSIQKPFQGTAEIKNFKLDMPLSAPKDLSMSGKIALNKVSGEIPKNVIKAKNLELEGPFLIDLVSEMEIKKKEIKKLNLSGNMNFTDMSISFKDSFLKPKQIPLEITLNAQSVGETLSIQNTKFTLKDLFIDLSGQVTRLRQKPNYALDFSTSSFSLDDLGQFLPAVKNSNILGNMRLEAQFKGSPQDASQPMVLGFEINSSEITYTPPKTEEKIPRPKEEKTVQTPSKTVPEKGQKGILDRLRLNGKLKITKALLKDYRLWNLSAMISYKDKLLEMSPLQFQFYDGKFSSTTKIDLHQDDPKTEISANLEKLDLDKFLTARHSKAAGKFTGSLDAKLNLSMRGKDADQIKSSMSGNGEITVRDGMFKIFNLSETLADFPVIPQVAPNFKLSDEFDIFKTSLLVKNQRVENPDMHLKGKNHLIKCRGFLYFDGSLDYKGSYFLAQKEDYRKEIPFVVTGTISKPKPVPDVGKLLQNTVQGVFEKILTPKTEPSEPEETEPTNPLEDLLKETIPM